MPLTDARRALLLICGIAFAVSTNYTNHGPVLSFISSEFALNAASAGAIATAFFLGAAALMLFGGDFADRYGARGAVSAGFAVTCVGTIGCGLLAPTYPALLGWRFLGGLGGGFAFAAGASYTRGIFAARGQHLAASSKSRDRRRSLHPRTGRPTRPSRHPAPAKQDRRQRIVPAWVDEHEIGLRETR